MQSILNDDIKLIILKYSKKINLYNISNYSILFSKKYYYNLYRKIYNLHKYYFHDYLLVYNNNDKIYTLHDFDFLF